MKRIFPVCGLALWSALNSPQILALAQVGALVAPGPEASGAVYAGEKISLNFQDIEVRTVLQLLADFTRFNLVVSDAVEGSVTLTLQDVPWDQALELVLKSKDLDKRLEGNVLLVAPADEIAAREQHEQEVRNKLAEAVPLRRELVQVSHARAADIARLFESVTASQSGAEGRGSLTVDERTNHIIALQSPEQLEELRRIVAQLDVPMRQVMIEARIVEAGVDFERNLGVRWGGAINQGGKWSAGGLEPAGGSGDTSFVDLGIRSHSSGLGIAFISNNVLLDLELSAMKKPGMAKSSLNPRSSPRTRKPPKSLKAPKSPIRKPVAAGQPRCRSRKRRCRFK